MNMISQDRRHYIGDALKKMSVQMVKVTVTSENITITQELIC